MKVTSLILILLVISSCQNIGESDTIQPEKQISFALESKPHEYYVKQAELWWKEIEKDSAAEESWFNYYRACRNAQGTADWREDFVDESPALRLGEDIVALMERHIPHTFTYNYVKGSTRAVDPTYGPYLLKAYEMNPDFPGIQAAMVTYSVSTHNRVLRKEVNEKWKSLNTMNPGLLQYARNTLSPLEPNAILLTQHDNDSYPAWMLQDAYGLQPGILVLNIDFLLLEQFREKVFEELELPPFQIDEVNVNHYRKNWKNVVQYILGNYSGDRPLYLGLTVSPEWYEGYEDSLQLHGLALKLTKDTTQITGNNVQLYEQVWDLDGINLENTDYHGNAIVIDLNTNYLRPLKLAFEHYLKSDEIGKAESIRQLSLGIAERTNDTRLIEKTDSLFQVQ